MQLEEAISHAKRGNAILFTGAGFSFGASSSDSGPDKLVPDAKRFSKRLAEKLGSASEYPLQVSTQAFVKKFGHHQLVSELLSCFLITSVKEFHTAVAELPWARVYTTNYDNCFELAASRSTVNPVQWVPLTVDAPITSNKGSCVHINGHISNLSIQTLSDQVKLTHSSYSADVFANSKWSEQFRQDANFARAVIFIGYSMSDLDIARVLSSSPTLRDRTFFIVSPSDDEITLAPLSDYGIVHGIGIEGFAELVSRTPVTIDSAPHHYTWLVEYQLPSAASRPTDVSAIELITKGSVIAENMAWAMASSSTEYCVRRSEIDDLIEKVKQGKQWFLCHADMGNGKSVLKEQLSYYLMQEHYRIFWDTENDNHKAADLRSLTREHGDIVVVLDASSERFEAIDGLLQLNLPNITVFVFARTTLFELGEARYNSHMPEGYVVIDLNRLVAKDVEQFVLLYNRLGLWGARARLLDSEKQGFIRINCQGAISKFIVSTFEDSEIGRKIQKAASLLLNNKSELASLIVASFLANRVGHAPSPELLQSITNIDLHRFRRATSLDEAAEFIRFDQGAVRIRSSIVSDFLLRTSISSDVLIWHIEKFVRRLAEIKRNNTLHHMFTELQRFPVLSAVVGSDVRKKKDAIVSYYQSIKDLLYCQKNALFWLHYAMARLEFNEFAIASKYFEQAREFAKGNQSDTRDVNNHYAKFLIDSRIRSEEYTDFFKAFELAHQILIEQMNKDTNRHFPYRQAARYVEFISYRKDILTPVEVQTFVSACKQVQAAIKNIRGHLANSPEVRRCFESMDRAIEVATAN